jgi:hypothetical protein
VGEEEGEGTLDGGGGGRVLARGQEALKEGGGGEGGREGGGSTHEIRECDQEKPKTERRQGEG